MSAEPNGAADVRLAADPEPRFPRGLLLVGGALVALVVLAAVVSFFWTPQSVLFTDTAHRNVGPGVAGHFLGTDIRGRDVASHLMAGAQTVLYVGLLAVGIAAVVGTPLGILAGMVPRGWTELILRVTDVWLAFPALLMALIFATVFGSSLTSAMVAIGVAPVSRWTR